MNLKVKFVLLALLLALIVALIWPALPVRSNNQTSSTSQVTDASGSAAGVAEAQTAAAAKLAITNGTIIDGTGAGSVADGVVIIQDHRIVAAGRANEISVPVGADVFDAAGGTIMPGIINAHGHNTYLPATRRRFLAAGVTATCDMASSLADLDKFGAEGSEQGPVAARGFKSGPMITAPEGYPTSDAIGWDYQVATPAEARAAVEAIYGRGADMIKIALEPGQPQEPWPVLAMAEVRAAVETAHAYGLPVRVHVQQARTLDIALDAGVDAIEHTPLPFQEEVKLRQLQPGQALSLADFPDLEQQLRRMVAQGVILVPTLSVGTCVTYKLPRLESEARRTLCDLQLAIVGRFHHLGGMVALGNDYGNPGVERGMPLREMELLRAAGLSSLAVIEAGTRHAARVCGHGDELGTLEVGKLADIIVVDGDPLANLNVMQQVKLVIKDGEIVSR